MDYDIRNVGELDLHTESVLIIDLMDYVWGGMEDHILDALMPPEEGIYLPGDMYPIITKDMGYYPKSVYQSKNAKVTVEDRIYNIEDIRRLKEDIVDKDGNTVISYHRLHLLKKAISDTPSIPITVLLVAKHVVRRFIESNARYKTNNATAADPIYDLIKPECHCIIDSGDIEIPFKELIDKVDGFISGKSWKLFRVKFMGTALILEEGLDYRIYEWYLNKFEEEEEAVKEGLYE